LLGLTLDCSDNLHVGLETQAAELLFQQRVELKDACGIEHRDRVYEVCHRVPFRCAARKFAHPDPNAMARRFYGMIVARTAPYMRDLIHSSAVAHPTGVTALITAEAAQ